MIVDKFQLRPIVEGRVTQLRLLEEPRYQLGRRLPVNRRGKATVCHVRVREILAQPIGEATDLDVLAEGFASRLQYTQHWVERLGNARPEIVERIGSWLIRFELDTDEDQVRIMGKTGGYVSTGAHAIAGEDGEAVPKDVQDGITADAHFLEVGRWTSHQAEMRETLTKMKADPATRLKAGKEIRALERQLEALDRKLGKAA